MKNITYAESESYPVAILIKNTSFNKYEIQSNYVQALLANGVVLSDIVAFNLKYEPTGKVSVKFMKEYLETLLETMDSVGVKWLYVADANYFKVLTKQTKAEQHLGYVLPCTVAGYEHMNVVLGINYQVLIYNPELKDKLNLSLKTLSDAIAGKYVAIGGNIIHSAQYPETVADIAAALASLHQYPALTADIEAFSLRFNEAGIGTIAFAWDQHNGVAFACDYAITRRKEDLEATPPLYGYQEVNREVRALLLKFFLEYKGELTFHGSTYDVKVIIYTLWMQHLLDTKGLLQGLDVMTARMHDTMIVSYLATNSTAGNVLGLKPLAHAFAGNWAKEDIKDIRRIPLGELLQYNLIDALSTWFLKTKYTPVMLQDQQGALYTGLMLPSLKLIIQMELTGMPMDPQTIQSVKADLEQQQEKHRDTIMNSDGVRLLNGLLQTSAMEAKNAKLKVKQHTLDHFDGVEFNPNSGPQLQRLLYEQMGLPVLDYTDTKQPATGADTIEKLIHHVQDPAHKDLLSALIGFNKVSKILSTFIPAFEQGVLKADGMHYLHGGFKLGGTVSGRLSSSRPNMQNLPAGSTFGKLIKSCFKAPKGWVMAGADFNALEARIDALLTKDKNKLAVYTDGMDSHSFNTLTYWPDKMPGITKYLTEDHMGEQHYRVEYSDGSIAYLPESLLNEP